MAAQTPLCSERCVWVYKELGDSLISRRSRVRNLRGATVGGAARRGLGGVVSGAQGWAGSCGRGEP